VIEGGYCGGINMTRMLGYNVYDIKDCAGRAGHHGYKTFIVGEWHKRGWCIGGNLDGDLTEGWNHWRATIEDPKCPPSNSDPSKPSMAAYETTNLVPPTYHMFWSFYDLIPVGADQTPY